jgi:ubiquinone/menaquinone biosynthesis C-methylase UbiE
MANNRHFDFLAPLYDRIISPSDPQQMKALLDLPARGWMLDAGGGTGRASAVLCPLVDQLVISDLSFPMLAQSQVKETAAANKTRCLAPTQARVERLPFPDGCFSRILVVDAFHHFGDQPGALRELVRVLQPGGRLLIEEPDIRRFPVKLIALAETLALMGSRFRAPAVMRAMLSELGLDARVETRGTTAWVIGQKRVAQPL